MNYKFQNSRISHVWFFLPSFCLSISISIFPGEGKRKKLIVSLIAIFSISILGSIVFGWRRFLARKKGKSLSKDYRGTITLGHDYVIEFGASI